MLKLLREEKGSVAVIMALMFTVLMGFASLVVDVGNLYLNKSRLSNIADAAALAAAQDLPGEPAQAVLTADNYAASNGSPGDRVQASVNSGNTVVTVTVTRTVPLFFAKVFNLLSSDVSATSRAANQVVTGISGTVPFSVEKQNFIYGNLYTLKEGGGSGSNGDYGALSLGGSGASVYGVNIKNGYNGKLQVGQWVETEPGNMSGPTGDGVSYRIAEDPVATFDTVQPGSARIIIVPIIDSLDVAGRGSVLIVGFGAFFLESVGGSGSSNYVTGRFMRLYTMGDTSGASSATDYGLHNISLIP